MYAINYLPNNFKRVFSTPTTATVMRPSRNPTRRTLYILTRRRMGVSQLLGIACAAVEKEDTRNPSNGTT